MKIGVGAISSRRSIPANSTRIASFLSIEYLSSISKM